MNQLTSVHEKSTSNKNQKTEQAEEIEIIRRKERIAALVSSRRMYRLENSDVFYIESSSQENVFHYCKMNFTTEFKFCSCNFFEFKGKVRNCCHLDMIPVGIMRNVIIDVQKLPVEAKKYSYNNSQSRPIKNQPSDINARYSQFHIPTKSLSYWESEYSY